MHWPCVLLYASSKPLGHDAQGIASMILESPYYGSRRPPWQEGSKLRRVSDLLTLGRATIEESLYLLAWAQRQQYRHLGKTQKQLTHGSKCRTHALPCLGSVYAVKGPGSEAALTDSM